MSCQFYWSDAADTILIANGCGHLYDKAEHLYILVREGHGVSMTDDWQPARKEHKASSVQQRLRARAGDDNRIYLQF